MNPGIVLCEIAKECVREASQFIYAKKGWQLMDFFAPEQAEILLECIKKCEEARPRKLVFKAIKKDAEWILVLLQQASHAQIRPLDMEMGATLLPIVFKDFRLESSLDFAVADQEKISQRPLKTYVSSKLYDALYDRHQTLREGKDKPLNLPDCFQSKLRKYQERSVCWMLSREQELNEFAGNYSVLQAVDGHTRVLKHDYCLEFYPFQEELQKIALPPGGILADEMGLGKTVEFLAMMLLNPRAKGTFSNNYWLELLESIYENVPLKQPRQQRELFCICNSKKGKRIQCSNCRLWQHESCMNRSGEQDANDPPYVCPSCWSELGGTRLVESGTTIIVSPNAIKMQWFNELQKHISPALKVLLYPGLHSGSWYSPLQLAEYDVVLTDYLILRSEIYHTADYKSDRQMRHQQLYLRPSCPLLMVNWWRVCLDEAQMVESSTSQAAEMVRMLPAVNRWAVTGTIDDLPPLLQFVGFNEACQPAAAWQTVDKSFQLNYNPKPLLDLLEHRLWRTCMSKVKHELGIPPQTEVVHRLELSNVEALYYREEHIKCHDHFREEVAKHTHHNEDNSSRLASISPQLLRYILKPFLHIRKTCSVPVVHNNANISPLMDPQELLDHLISNNETECKKELRSWASSYNGSAAIYFIRENYGQAIRQYKLLLKLAADYNKDNISVDSVLQIHALYNILQANDLAAPQFKLSDIEETTYQSMMKAFEWKYLDDTSRVLQSALNAYQLKIAEYQTLEERFSGSIVEFLATVVNYKDSLHDAMWNKVREEFIKQNISADKLEGVQSVRGIVYEIEMWHQRLEDLKSKLIAEFEFLEDIIGRAVSTVQAGEALTADITSFIGKVSDCHLAEIMNDDNKKEPKKKPKKPLAPCRLCQIRETLNKFECLLVAKVEDETEGLQKPSMEIGLLKIIFTFVRGKPEFSDYLGECKIKLDLLSCLQGLAKAMAKYWIEVEYMVKSFDELEMCKMRILLTDNPNEQSNYRILSDQIDEQLETNLHNLDMAQRNFTRLSGRLKYLKHLKQDTSAAVCPICHTDEDPRFVMMVCGHFLCEHCLAVMEKRTSVGSTKCPICRQNSPQLYRYIRDGSIKPITGNFSTKFACMVELILKIKAVNQQDKILIFSQWQVILDHIAIALKLNKIEHRKCSNKDLLEFKSSDNNITCLLMPLSRGSKGLNLIEATHVFLVEPILNPGDERQAIGRIHRFGQTKATTVHRFVMNGTIEENILKLITSADDSQTLGTHWDLGNMTLDSLKKLFILKSNVCSI
ncbi:E3 ubiquitin-protein ligase SHPRH [Drosophila madeirensis]|uniref:E3 ubiquitin-protein ligase SHPRH n=1 Tax=Drosophila madeirensis TaxID=30013 RepID=A0AAU9FUW3_DROMD